MRQLTGDHTAAFTRAFHWAHSVMVAETGACQASSPSLMLVVCVLGTGRFSRCSGAPDPMERTSLTAV